jgi:hypothetical protein
MKIVMCLQLGCTCTMTIQWKKWIKMANDKDMIGILATNGMLNGLKADILSVTVKHETYPLVNVYSLRHRNLS